VRKVRLGVTVVFIVLAHAIPGHWPACGSLRCHAKSTILMTSPKRTARAWRGPCRSAWVG